jgi:histidinol dehydrogenase
MKIIKYPPRHDWDNLLARPVHGHKHIKKIVKPIIRKVMEKGDKALFKFSRDYDHVNISTLEVPKKDWLAAESQVDEALKSAIDRAHKNIHKFHKAQVQKELKVETMPGVICRRKSLPIPKVGLYIPGGTAPLFSTVLMLGIPAVIAGCQEIVMCTPPDRKGNINPAILYTAQKVGIQRIFRVGGAQAVAAMAFGTESIPKVDKIFGPGNQYVTMAKQMISERGIAIDMPAGPSEVAVLADKTAIPSFVAADLLSQAEHGVDSQVILVSTSEKMIHAVLQEIDIQLEKLPRKEMAAKSLANSKAILVKDNTIALDLLNLYAAEHLILSVENADELADKVLNAGSVFIGNFTPESAGDYASGTNHTLPTNGFAKAWSGVSLDSFVKKVTYQRISPEGIKALGPSIEKMALAENLMAHKEAVSIRLKYLEDKNV